MKNKVAVTVLFFLSVVGSFIPISSLYAENIETEDEVNSLLDEEIADIFYPKRKFKLKFRIRQRADSWDSKLDSSFSYRVYVEPDFKLKISKVFFFDMQFGIGSTIGSVQSRFGDLRAGSVIILRDSRLFYRNSWKSRKHFLKLSLGAIDQRSFLNNSLLVSRRALPGLEQIYKYEHKYKKSKSYGFDLRFFEGIPTSQSITLDFNEKEDTPFYYNGKLELFIKDLNPKLGYRLSLHAGFFDFSPLPAVISDESRLYGNTVNGFGAASNFEYDYKGWYAGWKTVLSYNNFELFPYLSVLTNTEAPSGRNQAQEYGAVFKYHDQKLYSLSFEPYTYFNESDASVASYNGTTAGHNNREGYGMNLALELPKRGLKFKFSYVYTDVLEENGDLQVPYHYAGFRMEYKHEI